MKDNQQETFGLCPLHHPGFCGKAIDRRDFLKGVAMASVGAGAALGAIEQVVAAETNRPLPI